MLIRLKTTGFSMLPVFAKPTVPHCIVFGDRLKGIAFGTPFEALPYPNKVRANVALGIPTFYRQSSEPSLELFHIAPNARKSLPPPTHE